MPVEFLTAEQRAWYGQFTGAPTPEELARYFHLDNTDRAIIAQHRGDHNQLGFAVQLCTARFLGTFLEDLTTVPARVLAVLAQQLAIPQAACFTPYAIGQTRWEHTTKIRALYGYRDFSDGVAQLHLNRWLYALCWTGMDRPGLLFERATVWLIVHKVLLPGVTVLERHVARVRSRVQERVWGLLSRGLSPTVKSQLEALLTVPADGHLSLLERLRRGPFHRSAPELVRALRRVEEIRALGLPQQVSQRVPPYHLQALTRLAMTAKADTLQRFTESRRLATLVAFAATVEAVALDDALDLFDILLTEIFSDATKAGQTARLRTLKDLDAAALQLAHVGRLVLHPDVTDEQLRHAIFRSLPPEELETAVVQIEQVARPPEDLYYEELQQQWRRVRHFLPAVLATIRFGATPAGAPIRAALDELTLQEHRVQRKQPPLEVVTKAWRKYVLKEDGVIDRKAYTFCCLDRVRAAVRRRDLFVTPSLRYADARSGLLSGAAWEAARPLVCRSLVHSLSADETLATLSRQLDATYRTVAAKLPTNPAARIETREGKEELVLTGLEKLDEPPSLVRLRAAIKARLPRVELPELLLEIAAQTGFTTKFTHVSERDSQVTDLTTTICAVLLAEACNIGLDPLVRDDVPALRRSRLSWVLQNFVRTDTLTAANACLVAAQNRIPLVHAWGGGEVASADGLRLVVPVRTLHAGSNPKYFGYDYGITYYNLMSNQFTGLNAIVVPGTLRDSLFLLALVLDQATELTPHEIMTDTSAYTDVVFGLFWLLGYRFSPRIADIGGARYWRMDPTADYGLLNRIARHRLRPTVIKDNWDDMLRLAGSLKLGVVQALSIMRTLQIGDRPTKLAQAVAELGRIDKTMYCLTYIDDEAKRRRILSQLNHGEDRHKLARFLFHGKRGELRQRYREGQEDQLGALGLVVNIIVLWNTLYIDAALHQLAAEGFPIQSEDVARLSPLLFDHINLLGRFAFSVPESVQRGELRPLRTPAETLSEMV